MQFLLLGLLLVAAVLLLRHGLTGRVKAKTLRMLKTLIGGLLIIAGATLAVRGGFVYAFPLVLAGLYLVMTASAPSTAKSGGQTSSVTTEFLEMELDHDTGDIRGLVIKGIFKGRRIERLKPAELALLWHDVRVDDPASAQLIEAYLDSAFPTWRDDMARGEQEMAGPDGRMTKQEAYEILGLKPGASADAIRRAHKDLILKLHPDRGGSTYLASKINEAKAVLLGGGESGQSGR